MVLSGCSIGKIGKKKVLYNKYDLTIYMGKSLSDIYPQVLELAIKLINAKEKLDKLFKNPNRKEIYNLIKKKPLSITDISKTISLSYDSTHTHVKLLEEYGLIEAEKHNKTRGRKVIVQTTNKSYSQLQKEFTENFGIALKQKLTS